MPLITSNPDSARFWLAWSQCKQLLLTGRKLGLVLSGLLEHDVINSAVRFIHQVKFAFQKIDYEYSYCYLQYGLANFQRKMHLNFLAHMHFIMCILEEFLAGLGNVAYQVSPVEGLDPHGGAVVLPAGRPPAQGGKPGRNGAAAPPGLRLHPAAHPLPPAAAALIRRVRRRVGGRREVVDGQYLRRLLLLSASQPLLPLQRSINSISD